MVPIEGGGGKTKFPKVEARGGGGGGREPRFLERTGGENLPRRTLFID